MTDDQQRDYEQFLQERNRISSFVEHATLTLYKKYGTSTKDQERDAFIAEEKKRIRAALKALFTTASDIAQRYHRDLGSLTRDFYKARIEQSIACFKARFSEHKTVQVSSTQTDGQNVAQAQAQALALALAEACNETLTESVVEAQQGLENLELTMFKDRLAPASLDFLRDATLLAAVDSLPQISDAIRPSERARIQLSPGIRCTRELSHYALAHPSNNYIFISHDEAEAFRHAEATNPGSCRPYTLHDIRHPERLPDALDRFMQPLPDGNLTQLSCHVRS